VNPNFPEGGEMSQYLDEMNIGDLIQVQGPTGNLEYQGQGKFAIKDDVLSPPQTIQVKRLSMIAGNFLRNKILIF
jgi:hypothetical protein